MGSKKAPSPAKKGKPSKAKTSKQKISKLALMTDPVFREFLQESVEICEQFANSKKRLVEYLNEKYEFAEEDDEVWFDDHEVKHESKTYLLNLCLRDIGFGIYLKQDSDFELLLTPEPTDENEISLEDRPIQL